MFNKLKLKIQKEILALIILIIISTIFTLYHNFTKKEINNNYKQIIDNVYFKKTINHLFNKFEPRFKKISHKVEIGETFDSILEKYLINKKEIEVLKNKLTKKVNLNKLKTNQKILLTIDQSENSIKEFIFQVSNKERVELRDIMTLETKIQKKRISLNPKTLEKIEVPEKRSIMFKSSKEWKKKLNEKI